MARRFVKWAKNVTSRPAVWRSPAHEAELCELVRDAGDDPRLDGARVQLGALGLVTEVTLRRVVARSSGVAQS